jgi:hypothetical protein
MKTKVKLKQEADRLAREGDECAEAADIAQRHHLYNAANALMDMASKLRRSAEAHRVQAERAEE